MRRVILSLITLIFLTLPAKADTISFSSVMDAALKHSHEIKMSNIDIKISKEQANIERSAYFPTLLSGVNSEKVTDLQNNSAQVNVIGNQVLPGASNYQDSVYLSAQYKLFDFGARSKRVSIAKKDVKEKQHALTQSVREVKLNVVDLYFQALAAYKTVSVQREILYAYKDILLMKQKLYENGVISKLSPVDDAINVAKTIDKIESANVKLNSVLSDLSVYTGQKYNSDILIMEDFKDNSNIVPISLKAGVQESDFLLQQTPEFKIYQLEIEKRRAEISALRRERLPQVNLYSNYIFYGRDPNSIFAAYGDTQKRSATIGFSTTLTLFDGLKTQSTISKLKYEINRLESERDLKVANVQSKFDKLVLEDKSNDNIVKNQQEMLDVVNGKLEMIQRLVDQNLADKPTLLTQKVAFLNQRLNIEVSIANQIATKKKLNIIKEGQK